MHDRSGRLRAFPYRIATSTFQTTSRWQTYLLLGVSGVLIMVLTVGGLWWYKHRRGAATGPKNTIAVLPLQNMNGDISVDFLRYALADEIANVLTYTRTLDVRPSSLTQKYAGHDVDPQKVGRELHVATVLTGHFLKHGENLLVTLEAIDVRDNRLSVADQLYGSGAGPDRLAVGHGSADPSRTAAARWA